MKVIDPGHVYELHWLDGTPEPMTVLSDDRAPSSQVMPNTLTFVKREGDGYPGNVGHHAGTNLQDVLRVLIDRVQYLDGQIPSEENDSTLLYLRCALLALEYRAARRHGRLPDFKQLVEFKHALAAPELMATCKTCGHIGCEGTCHP